MSERKQQGWGAVSRFLTGFALVAALAVAPGNAEAGTPLGQKWTYDPAVGLEGMAQVTDGKRRRLEVECGNGGGPGITLYSPGVNEGLLGKQSENLLMEFEIDSVRFMERYSCFPNGSMCISEGFPSYDLIENLRKGTSVTLKLEGNDLATFSLKGSDDAIAPLSYCLGPEAY